MTADKQLIALEKAWESLAMGSWEAIKNCQQQSPCPPRNRAIEYAVVDALDDIVEEARRST